MSGCSLHGDRRSVVEHRRVRDADYCALGRLEPSNCLPPGFFSGFVQQVMSSLDEFACCRSNGLGAEHIELDADLRYGSLCRPGVGTEAGVSGLRQWPYPKDLQPSIASLCE
jgi:hypothetical protein